MIPIPRRRLLVRAAITSLALLSIAGATAARADEPPFGSVPGALGLWSLDAGYGTTVPDSSGGDANGSLTGGASWVSAGGPALSFEGNGAVDIPVESRLEPVTAVSVAAWVRSSSSPGPYAYIAAKGAAGCFAASYGLYTGAKGGLEFYVAGTHASRYVDSPDAGQRIWDGRWHLVVGTYDGAAVRLYVDGTEVDEGSPHTGALHYTLPGSNEFVIGNYPLPLPESGCQAYAFTGDVGEIGVWGSALTPQRLAALSGGSTSPGGPGTGSGGGGSSGGGTGAGSPVGGTPGGQPGSTGSLPVLSHLKLSPGQLTLATPEARHWARRLTIHASYWASEASRTTLTLQVRRNGRMVGARCIADAGGARRAGARCSWWATVRRITHHDRPDRNRVVMRLRQRGLSPGRSRLLATPRFAGRWGLTRRAALTIARRGSGREPRSARAARRDPRQRGRA